MQFFNGFSHATISKGTQKPKTGRHQHHVQPAIVRYREVYTIHNQCCACPFNTEEYIFECQLTAFHMLTLMKAAREQASAGIGCVISMGCDLLSAEKQAYIQSTILRRVSETLPELHFRVQKCYALVLTATEMVSVNRCTDCIALHCIHFYGHLSSIAC